MGAKQRQLFRVFVLYQNLNHLVSLRLAGFRNFSCLVSRRVQKQSTAWCCWLFLFWPPRLSEASSRHLCFFRLPFCLCHSASTTCKLSLLYLFLCPTTYLICVCSSCLCGALATAAMLSLCRGNSQLTMQMITIKYHFPKGHSGNWQHFILARLIVFKCVVITKLMLIIICQLKWHWLGKSRGCQILTSLEYIKC